MPGRNVNDNSGTLSDDILIHADKIKIPRCCYITGLLDAARHMNLTVGELADMMIAMNVTPRELTMPCAGKSRGV
jgi:hypothetical protein